ncbi:MAG: exodeoxyribonuclease VII large subunit [Eggerthellaceae bacterium]|nr:exodeoxyribonuclease VII large subunit [Eggerthellaceae bacterium]
MEENQETPASEPLSVSAALGLAKNALESFTVKLIGEVSEVNNKPGYKAVYFTVKDDKASLPCMMWLNRFDACGIDLRMGMLVELTGRFSLYAPKGRMNFDVFSITLAGEGNLRLQVANLAKKLQAEGLMVPAKKRAIPDYPQRIGLVTSPRGAAVHDVLRTLRRRFPLAHILLAGVPVEGDGAAAGLIEGLHAVEQADVEVVLLVRGGGSFEDLMPFNDEALARAIAALSVPVVTGIGHEPDTSIADMVADTRASTPTAAAEAVSPSPEFLGGLIAGAAHQLSAALKRKLERFVLVLEGISVRPIFADANMLFATESQTLDMTEERLFRAIPLNIARDRSALEHARERLRAKARPLLARFDSAVSLSAARLHDLSPLIILGRGYAVAKNADNAILKSVSAVAVGDSVGVELHDGRLVCHVDTIEEWQTSMITLEERDE